MLHTIYTYSIFHALTRPVQPVSSILVAMALKKKLLPSVSHVVYMQAALQGQLLVNTQPA